MDEMVRLNVMLEAVFYESTVSSLVDFATAARHGGHSREQILHDITTMLLQNLDTPGKQASVAAMAVVMLDEKRSEHGKPRRRHGAA